MKTDYFKFYLEDNDEIDITKGITHLGEKIYYLTMGDVNILDIKDKQLLDLGMKIQSVINQIDRENREKV